MVRASDPPQDVLSIIKPTNHETHSVAYEYMFYDSRFGTAPNDGYAQSQASKI